jgi:hypothetical protein
LGAPVKARERNGRKALRAALITYTHSLSHTHTALVRTFMHTYTHTHIHTCTHTHVRTHAQTPKNEDASGEETFIPVMRDVN